MTHPTSKGANRAEAIARLKDLARKAMGIACHAVATPGFRALPQTDQSCVRELVETFDAFTPDNDPHGECDFGAIYQDASGHWTTQRPRNPGETVFWKIDCYERDLQWASEDATNAAITRRVLTIMWRKSTDAPRAIPTAPTTKASTCRRASITAINRQPARLTTTGSQRLIGLTGARFFLGDNRVILLTAATIWDLRVSGCSFLGLKTSVRGTELPRVVLSGLTSRKAYLDLCAYQAYMRITVSRRPTCWLLTMRPKVLTSAAASG